MAVYALLFVWPACFLADCLAGFLAAGLPDRLPDRLPDPLPGEAACLNRGRNLNFKHLLLNHSGKPEAEHAVMTCCDDTLQEDKGDEDGGEEEGVEWTALRRE